MKVKSFIRKIKNMLHCIVFILPYIRGGKNEGKNRTKVGAFKMKIVKCKHAYCLVYDVAFMVAKKRMLQTEKLNMNMNGYYYNVQRAETTSFLCCLRFYEYAYVGT